MRSGKYVKQTGGFSAFIPAPLPPEPPIYRDSELDTLLSQADRLDSSPAGQRLFDYLFQQPLFSVSMVQRHLDCSYVTANKLVLQFEKLNLLNETTGWKRNRRYRFQPYLDLFQAETLPALPSS